MRVVSARCPVPHGLHAKDLVSVIMPAFNAQGTLVQAAQSVLEQSHPSLELLIVDDGSTDATAHVLKTLAARDGRVRAFHPGKNQGVAKARNCAIQAARGRYIAFLDADDLWLPDKLALQLALMRTQGAHACMAWYYRFRTAGQWLGIVHAPPSITYAGLLRGNGVGNLTGVYDCHALGKFLQQPIGHEDYLMWLQVVQKAGRMVAVAQPLAAYRVGSGSLSADKLESARWTWDIYHRHLGLSAARSAYLMLHYAGRALFKRF